MRGMMGQIMHMAEKLKQKENKIWALAFTVLLCFLLSVKFDFYFDLNDDVMMKDMVAGVYTGVPESRNIQMLYPLSWFLSCLYRLAGTLPWYGIFICGCQFFCIYLLTERLLGFFEKRMVKTFVVCMEALILITLFLRELIFVQYTVTCALLTATAAFLFITADSSETAGVFLRRNIPSILLAGVAFLMRSEMFLLLLPFLCVCGVCRWAAERSAWTKENARKYFLIFGVILLVIGLGQAANMLGYHSAGWKEFIDYFDKRTELYDFQTIPFYEENKDFYDRIGLTWIEYITLRNYNLGIDEKIDAKLLGTVADQAEELKKEYSSTLDTFKRAFQNYRGLIFHKGEYPWNLFVSAMYITVLTAALSNRHFRYVFELLLLGIVRTGLWMFILYRGRYPVRITHSLYLVELIILFGMLLWEGTKEKRLPIFVRVGVVVLLVFLVRLGLSDSVEKTKSEYLYREEVNQELRALQAYTRQNPDNFYFVDVYSMMPYSEKMFVGTDNSLSNYDIMGGWTSKSPLTYKKFQAFSFDTMEAAIPSLDNVFLIVQEPELDWLPTLAEWVQEYYREKGIWVSVQKVDVIKTGEREVFSVWAVE